MDIDDSKLHRTAYPIIKMLTPRSTEEEAHMTPSQIPVPTFQWRQVKKIPWTQDYPTTFFQSYSRQLERVTQRLEKADDADLIDAGTACIELIQLCSKDGLPAIEGGDGVWDEVPRFLSNNPETRCAWPLASGDGC